MFLGFLGFRTFELFSKKKTIPHGSSGQTAMWKMIPYGSSSFQVFVKKCRKQLFLRIRFHFFRITLFSPFVRLKPVQAGFCVSIQTLIIWVIIIAIMIAITISKTQENLMEFNKKQTQTTSARLRRAGRRFALPMCFVCDFY